MLFLVFWIQWVLAVLLNICNTDLLRKQHKVTRIPSLNLILKKRSSLHSDRIYKAPMYFLHLSQSTVISGQLLFNISVVFSTRIWCFHLSAFIFFQKQHLTFNDGFISRIFSFHLYHH